MWMAQDHSVPWPVPQHWRAVSCTHPPNIPSACVGFNYFLHNYIQCLGLSLLSVPHKCLMTWCVSTGVPLKQSMEYSSSTLWCTGNTTGHLQMWKSVSLCQPCHLTYLDWVSQLSSQPTIHYMHNTLAYVHIHVALPTGPVWDYAGCTVHSLMSILVWWYRSVCLLSCSCWRALQRGGARRDRSREGCWERTSDLLFQRTGLAGSLGHWPIIYSVGILYITYKSI